MPEIPELGQVPDQTLNLETFGLASSLGGESRYQLYIHLQDTALASMVLVLGLHVSAISGIILRWMSACIHPMSCSPPPSSSCMLDNCERSYQKWPLSPQFFSWSMCPGLWLLFSPIVLLATLQARGSIFLCLFTDNMLSSSKGVCGELSPVCFVRQDILCLKRRGLAQKKQCQLLCHHTVSSG